MSGLQEISAVIAVVELGIRSTSALYNLIQTLRHIPATIEHTKNEIWDLRNCLTGLKVIQTADSGTIDVIDRTGLESSVSSCHLACDELQSLLSTWDPLQSRFEAKIKYFRDRKTFEGLLKDISTRKHNTILSLGITQLCLQAISQQTTMSYFLNPQRTSQRTEFEPAQQTALVVRQDRAAANQNTMLPANQNVMAPTNQIFPNQNGANQNYVNQAEPVATQATDYTDISMSATKDTQVFMRDVTADGHNHQIGMPRIVATQVMDKQFKGTIQRFSGTVSTGKGSCGNKIGMF
ncbi:hypothetical protein PG984_007009 [Apiospora sp. TS-2023a]